MSTNAAMKTQLQDASPESTSGNKGKPSPPSPQFVTIPVYFDENGFTSSSYSGIVNDTLRFTNQSSTQTLTVYILAEDGQSASNQLLSVTSQVTVGPGSYVDKTIASTGKFLFSLNPAPQDPPGDPTGGPVVVIVVSS